VSRRLFILVAAAAAALLLVPSALALRVHVRVEGKTRTIFGASEPAIGVQLNALDALASASFRGEFYYHVTPTAYGPYVDQVGRYAADASSGWVFKVNGVSPPVGADAVTLQTGDHVLWYWASFGSNGGPETLLLQSRGRNCYRVLAQNDAGKTRLTRGAVLHVGARTVRAKTGSACVGRHRGHVRATLTNAVRSNALS
jgi:hypothetical protein